MENMKHAKKLLGLLLALAMVLSLAATAFATGDGIDAAQTETVDDKTAGSTSGTTTGTDVGGNAGGKTQPTGTITIINAVPGQTYSIYRILDLESYSGAGTPLDENGNPTGGNYAYKANTKWNTFINGNDIKGVFVEVDKQGYVTWKDGADVVAFAAKAREYITQSGTASDGSMSATDNTLAFEGMPLGYYLLDSSMGTLCSLDTTNPNVKIKEKNGQPTVTKQVDENGTFGPTNDANISDVVKFQSIIKVEAGAVNYKFHDKMSDGLTFTNSGDYKVVVTWTDANGNNGQPKTTTLTGGADRAAHYKLIDHTASFIPGEDADQATFEIEFSQTNLCDKLEAGDTLTITYYATLNENATVGETGNKNDCWVTFGDDNTATAHASTTTYTWSVPVFKYFMDGETKKALAGAQFKLCKNSNGTGVIALKETTVENTYRVVKDSGATDFVITTDETGRFTIEGLDSGTYYLKETVAPSGYNLLPGAVEITISTKGEINVNPETNVGVDEVEVLNQSGTELPSTGGIGTTIFYVLGSALLIGAVVLLVARKRMNAEK